LGAGYAICCGDWQSQIYEREIKWDTNPR